MSSLLTGIAVAIAVVLTFTYQKMPIPNSSSYEVVRITQPIIIDGQWDKPAWEKIPALPISYHMGDQPGFKPVVEAKMQYDQANLYVIFRVQDQFVRVLTQNINGPVWKDACVEFFFAPQTSQPAHYFNLEINAGGIPLMQYSTGEQKNVSLPTESIQTIEIAHSLPSRIDPEIRDSVVWTLEYRVSLDMLEQHAEVTRPKPGVVWRANFYKIAENSSNPHYLTWAPVDLPKPNFHTPRFFGELHFR